MRPERQDSAHRARLDLALADHRRGDLASAESAYRRLLATQPRHPGALMGLGMIAYQMGNYDDALDLLKQAREAAPREPAVINNLGLVLAACGRDEEAVRAWRRVLTIDPQFADAQVNLAGADARAGHHESAISRLRRAMAAKPDCVPALANLGTLLLSRRRYSEALDVLRRAASLDPRNADVAVNIGRAFSECGMAREARVALESAVRLRPGDRVAASNFLMSLHYCDDTDAQSIAEAHQSWALTLEAKGRTPPRPEAARGRGKWRLGFLSGDFNDHAIMRFLSPLLAHLSPERTELYCYYTGSRSDFQTEAVQRRTESFARVGQMNDTELALAIRDDALDALIDLAGHSAGGRPAVLASRPAPLQVTWLGYLCATGLAAVDFRLTDAMADPPGTDAGAAIDRPWRLPAMWCYEPRTEAPSVASPPSAARGTITFGSTNNPAKISEVTLSLWAQVLRAVPDSHMTIYAHDDPMCRDRIAKAFSTHGVSDSRLHFFGREAPGEYLLRYSTIDVLLDTTPYCGGTTTCDALWMGVPVVTLAGDRPFSRTGASILHAAGFPQWVATDRDSYIAVAGALAGDIPALAEARMSLRETLAGSRLLDAEAMSNEFMDAMEAMWATVGLPSRS